MGLALKLGLNLGLTPGASVFKLRLSFNLGLIFKMNLSHCFIRELTLNRL
jgi:hypothetical protein